MLRSIFIHRPEIHTDVMLSGFGGAADSPGSGVKYQISA
jgi:hypothetical protein